MKEQDKKPQEQLSEVEIGIYQKRIWTNDSKNDPRSWKTNGGTD